MDELKPQIKELIEQGKLNLVESLNKIKELRKQATEKYNKSLDRFKALERERKFFNGWNNRIKGQ